MLLTVFQELEGKYLINFVGKFNITFQYSGILRIQNNEMAKPKKRNGNYNFLPFRCCLHVSNLINFINHRLKLVDIGVRLREN